jgi:predicted nucleic acid-binding protein
MSVDFLLDTNVLVYAYDRSAAVKQRQSFILLDKLEARGGAAITTQVLAEFFVVVTRKIAAPLAPAETYTRIEHLAQAWVVLDTTSMIVLEAARGVRDYRMSFWDAQLWAAARLNQIPLLLSEDFQSGAVIEGVRFVNPFASDFQLADWIG